MYLHLTNMYQQPLKYKFKRKAENVKSKMLRMDYGLKMK